MNDTRANDRLPPGQQLAARGKWPVVGERAPAKAPHEWTIEIAGEVSTPCSWTLDDLKRLPVVSRLVDIHCVTRWSLLDVPVRGVLLEILLNAAAPTAQAEFLSFVAHSQRNHSTSLPLQDATQLGAIVAWEVNHAPISVEHGGPVRMIVPGRYFYKSVKWLRRIDVLAEDRLGYWEADAGYHNRADPWREERFVTTSLSRLEVRQLLESRDWSDRDLLSLQVARRDLSHLVARRAMLRAANFRQAVLRGADFQGANLSNASFAGADLREADFADADIEGCDFTGADLRGANLCTQSMLGVSFTDGRSVAKIDRSTRIPHERLSELADAQRQVVVPCLHRQAPIP